MKGQDLPVEPWQVEQVEQVEGGLRGEHREWTGPVDSEGFGLCPNIRGIGPPLVFLKDGPAWGMPCGRHERFSPGPDSQFSG